MALTITALTLLALAGFLARRRGPDRSWLPDHPHRIDPSHPAYAEYRARNAFPAAPPRPSGGLGELTVGTPTPRPEPHPRPGDNLAW